MRTAFAAMLAIPLALSAPVAFSGEYHGFAGGNGLPSVTPWGDTYAGAVSTVTLRGSGTFFHVKGAAATTGHATANPPAPRIRSVSAVTSDCAWEAGVCVIRRN